MCQDLFIRSLQPSDVDYIVDIHVEAFQGFFLTFLGHAFLHELYNATLEDTSVFSFVAVEREKICGFVMGTAQPSGFYGRLLRYRWWRFTLVSLLPIIKRPAIVPRLFRAFTKPKTAKHEEYRGTLMSIAVLPEVQNKGIGQMLVQAFLEEGVKRGLQKIDLTTDRDDNAAANRFYQKLGFVCARTFTTPEERAMNEYVIVLHNE